LSVGASISQQQATSRHYLKSVKVGLLSLKNTLKCLKLQPPWRDYLAALPLPQRHGEPQGDFNRHARNERPKRPLLIAITQFVGLRIHMFVLSTKPPTEMK
jgi:hypothetical protein